MENIDKLKDKPMTSHHKEILRQNRVLLTDDIDPEIVCNYLLQDGLISPHIYDEVLESRVTRRTRNSYLLNILESRSDAAFYSLMKAIKEGSGQSYIVKKLERDDSNKNIRPKVKLRQSNSLPNVFPARQPVTRKLSVSDLKPASEESEGSSSSDSDTTTSESSDEDVEDDGFMDDDQYLKDVADGMAIDENEEDKEEEELHLLDMSQSTIDPSVLNTSNSSTDSNMSQTSTVSSETLPKPQAIPVCTTYAINRSGSAVSFARGASKQEGLHKTPSKNELVPLPSITSLFRFISPHVHSRWRELAYELGLTDDHIGGIKVIPYDRPSKYATTVLEKWAKVNKGKATKGKLMEVLTKMNIRKALDTLEKYKVSSNNTMRGRKKSTDDNSQKKDVKVAFTIEDDKPNDTSVKMVRNRKRNIVPPKPKVRVMKRQKGELQAHCKIQVQGPSSTSHGEKVFLEMAPKIMDAMIQRGDKAKEILNNLKELRGIVVTDIRKGSVIVVLVPFTLSYMNHLKELYHSGELKEILSKALITPEIKAEFCLDRVTLSVGISDENFEECRLELEKLGKSGESRKGETSEDVMVAVDDETDEGGFQISECSDPFVQKLFHGLGNLNEAITEMTRRITFFESSCSTFLLTLSLVQPTDTLTIHNLHQLKELQDLCKQSDNVQIREDLVQQYFNLHSRFKSRVEKLESDIYVNIKDCLLKEESKGVLNHYGGRVLDVFDELRIMLDEKYDFSGLSHQNLPKLVVRETMSYKGLLSYLLVLCDMLKAVRKTLRKFMKYL